MSKDYDDTSLIVDNGLIWSNKSLFYKYIYSVHEKLIHYALVFVALLFSSRFDMILLLEGV